MFSSNLVGKHSFVAAGLALAITSMLASATVTAVASERDTYPAGMVSAMERDLGIRAEYLPRFFQLQRDSLAREAGVSRSALTEKFAKYLGVAPMGYLTDWRLELGAEALRTSNRSVQDIAMGAGYESEAAFNRAFKRRFGTPPARYRREWRERPRHKPARVARRA